MMYFDMASAFEQSAAIREAYRGEAFRELGHATAITAKYELYDVAIIWDSQVLGTDICEYLVVPRTGRLTLDQRGWHLISDGIPRDGRLLEVLRVNTGDIRYVQWRCMTGLKPSNPSSWRFTPTEINPTHWRYVITDDPAAVWSGYSEVCERLSRLGYGKVPAP